MNILQKFEARQVEKTIADGTIPEFSPGDTVKVNVKIREGTRERVQAYEGVCIARSGKNDMSASFTVRKISLGEGVERVFPLFSPRIESIEVVRRGSVRRAKLYFLRDRRGKSARITERTTGHGIEVKTDETTDNMTQTAKRAAKKANKAKATEERRNANEKVKADKQAAKDAEAKAAADAAAAEAKAAEEAANAEAKTEE